MHVCMHVCMYACMRACMYVCMHICMYACMYVCMYVCIYSLRVQIPNMYVYIYNQWFDVACVRSGNFLPVSPKKAPSAIGGWWPLWHPQACWLLADAIPNLRRRTKNNPQSLQSYYKPICMCICILYIYMHIYIIMYIYIYTYIIIYIYNHIYI